MVNGLKEDQMDYIATKRCVKSLFSNFNKKDMLMSNSVDWVMRETHRKEV